MTATGRASVNGAPTRKTTPQPPRWFQRIMHYVGWSILIVLSVLVALGVILPLVKLVIFLFGWVFNG